MSAPDRIAVVGAGTMGRGIAEVAAIGGASVDLVDNDETVLEAALTEVRASMDVAVTRGKVDHDHAEAAFARIEVGTDLLAGVSHAQLVIEAIPEDIGAKIALMRDLSAMAPTAVLASNTSALSITELAAAAADPSRVVGMHFFNPVPKMGLCELVRGLQTSESTLAAAEQAAWAMGKTTIRVEDVPGFATSRLNALLGNEAMRMLEQGVASAEDIDTATRLGLNHPMGPLEMADLVGLDVRLAVLEHLHATLGEAFRPTNLHRQLVAAGHLGRKTGRGIHRYDADGRRR